MKYLFLVLVFLNLGLSTAVSLGWEPRAAAFQSAAYLGAAGFWLALAMFSGSVKR